MDEIWGYVGKREKHVAPGDIPAIPPVTSAKTAVQAAMRSYRTTGMPSPKTKPNKIGRPKLPRGEAKGLIVPVRFNAEDLKRITAAAKSSKKTVSEWIRSTLNAATT
jgi:hypothetical protein